MRMGFKCWKCGDRATSVKLKNLTPTLMEAGYRCRNVDCGHTFVVALEAIRTLNPGAFPSPPGINVPLSRHVRRRELMLQLEHLPDAEGTSMNVVEEVEQMELCLEGPGHRPSS